MGGKAKPITFAEIAEAFAKGKSGQAGIWAIAYRLKRSTTIVRRALAVMVDRGLCRHVGPPHMDVFEMTAGADTTGQVEPQKPRGPLPKELRAAANDVDPDDVDPDDVEQDDLLNDMQAIGAMREHVIAAALWAERMGDHRWRDDPRATAERMQARHLLPPFMSTLARDA